MNNEVVHKISYFHKKINVCSNVVMCNKLEPKVFKMFANIPVLRSIFDTAGAKYYSIGKYPSGLLP